MAGLGIDSNFNFRDLGEAAEKIFTWQVIQKLNALLESMK